MYNSCQGDSARRQRYHINTALPDTAQQKMHHFSLMYLRESARLLSNYAFDHFNFFFFPVKLSSDPLELLTFRYLQKGQVRQSRKHCFVDGAIIIYNSSIMAKLGQFFGDEKKIYLI